jgi:general secretion pathway protein G
MKPGYGAIVRIVMLAVGLFSLPAWGQETQPQEQPQPQRLTYRYSNGIDGTPGGNWGQVLPFQTDAPRGVALPKFNCKDPAFVLWKVGVGKLTGPAERDKGLWIALDRSKADGPYDTLYVDANGDGSLADEKPVRAGRAELREGHSRSVFGTVQISLPGKDEPIIYHVRFQCLKVDGYPVPVLHVVSCGWYSGEVTIAGLKYSCSLSDNNADARFGQYDAVATKCDQMGLHPARGEEAEQTAPRRTGPQSFGGYIGKYVLLGDTYYSFDIVPDGSAVTIAPAKPAMGRIQGRPGVQLQQVRGPMGEFSSPGVNGALEVPAGEYIPLSYTATRNDGNGRSWRVLDNGCGKEVPYTVKAGETTTVDIGDPFVWHLRWINDAPGYYKLSQTVRSIRGDGVAFSGSDGSVATLRITNADGSYDFTVTMEGGGGGNSSYVWKVPSDVKGPFTAISLPIGPFRMFQRATVIGAGEMDSQAPRPLGPNAIERFAIKTDIANLEVALSVFELDTGRYPTNDEDLDALMQKPEGITGWNGPYIKNMPVDPWGRPYLYRCPGRHNPAGFDLISIGYDCWEGTADDIGNWPAPKASANEPQPVPLIPWSSLREAGQ